MDVAPAPGRTITAAAVPEGPALQAWRRWVRTAILLVAVLYLIVVLTGVMFRPWNLPRRAQEAGAMVTATVAFFLMRSRPRLAASLALLAIWAEATLSTIEVGQLLSPSILGYPALVVVAGLLLGTRASLAVAVASVATLWSGLWLRAAWTGEPSLGPEVKYTFLVLACVLVGIAVLTRATLVSYRAALGEAERAGRRYVALFESAPDGVIVLDEEQRIEELNPIAASLLGGEVRTLSGAPLSEALARAGAPGPVDLAAARPGAPLAIELSGGDGPRALELTARAAEPPAGGRALLVLRDVTERRRIEERLGHSQRLEMVGQLAGGVAHDFNNLLTAVAGNAAVLREHPDPTVRELAAEIEDARRHGSALVRQLLAFARRDVRQIEAVDACEAVAGISALMQRVLPETHRLETTCAGGPVVAVDRAQLEQVILNLVTNARDAMPAGGTIAVAVRALASGEAARLGSPLTCPCQAVLEVADQGSGIAPEVRARMFEPFFTTKPRGQGTGLGLSTVHGIVAQSGGHVAVESAPGRGSCFRVFLPAAEPGAVAAAPPLRPGPVGRGEAVLLVEDDPNVRSLVRRLLDQAGYRVTEAADAGAALALDEGAAPPALLLTDVGIPGMPGTELAVRLRARWPRLRVLYMSGYWTDGDARRELLDPALNVLQKPFERDELLLRVRALLEAPPAAGLT